MHKLETHLLLSIGSGDAEHEFPVLVVEYRHVEAVPMRRDGYLAGPAEPEHVEIGSVYVVTEEPITNGYAAGQTFPARHPLPEWMVEPLTEQLERLCLADWHGANEYAREQAAEMRREDLMLERRPLVAE